MEINYLKEFVALAQTCQFQKTADDLFISQSSLSKHIKVIEQEFGRELLRRSTRRVELTEFGRAFLPYATQIADLQREYTVNLLESFYNKKVVIGIGPIITMYTMEKYMDTFSERHPDYQIEFIEENESELRNLLRRGECDLIIVSRDSQPLESDVCSVPYTTDILVAVLAQDHTLTKKECLTIGDLELYPFIQKGSTNFARLLNPALPPSAYTACRSSVLMNLIRSKKAVAVLPSYAAKNYMRHDAGEGITTMKLIPETRLHLDMLYLKTRQNNSVIHSLSEYLLERNASAHEPASGTP